MGTEVSAASTSAFAARHIGPTAREQQVMLRDLGLSDLQDLVDQVVPEPIRLDLDQACAGLPSGCSESQALAELREIAAANQAGRSLIGLGYYDCITRPCCSGTFSKIRPGTRPTPPTKPRSAKGAWRPCSISRP